MTKQEKILKIISILKKNYGNTMLASFSNLNAWKILIATILSARSKDEQTAPISKTLFKRYRTPKSLAKAKNGDVEKIIKKIGFYRQKAKYIIKTSRMIIDEHNGKVPNNYEGLLTFPGVGRKVAGCVLREQNSCYSLQDYAQDAVIIVQSLIKNIRRM